MKALITGASKGIGWAIAQKLASKNFDLVLNARNIQELEACKDQLLEKYPSIIITCIASDLSTKAGVFALSDPILNSEETLDILINNAGVFLPGILAEEPEGTLEKMVETNLYSAYYLTKALLPKLLKSEQPHIFNMCSIASKIAYPNGGSYSISKFALLGFNKVLREELKDKGVKVTAILPGATWSNSWAGVDLPRARLMEASDIAIAVSSAIDMSPSAVVEEIIVRPQLGDL